MKMKQIIVAMVMMTLGVVGLTMTPAMAEGENLCDDPSISDEQKAAIGCGNETLCDGITDPELREVAGCNNDRGNTIMPVVTALLEVVMGVIGVIAVGVIIYGGVTYTTSTGDSAKTTKAKNIILYGIVGLVVALLAYALVAFVSKSLGV